MKIRVISPIFPSAVLHIDQHIEPTTNFIDIWSMFSSCREPKISDLEVELCELSSSQSKFVDVNTMLVSVLQGYRKDPVLFSFDFKKETKRSLKYESIKIKYLIVGLPENINTGQIIINRKNEIAGDIVEYITLRHSLLSKVKMKTGRNDYLMRNCVENWNDPNKNLEEFYMDLQFSNPDLQIMNRRMVWGKEESITIVLLSEISFICRKRPKESRVRISARNINKLKKIPKWIKKIGNKKLIAFCTNRECDGTAAKLNTFVTMRCEYPIVHVESKKETSKRINGYTKTAQRIIVSSEWKSFLSELQSQLDNSWYLFVLLPRKSGKTQLAYNLSHHYFVIYFDYAIFHRKDYSVAREAARGWEEYDNLLCGIYSESSICNFLDQLFNYCLSGNYLAESFRLVSTIVRKLGSKVMFTCVTGNSSSIPRFGPTCEEQEGKLLSYMIRPFPLLLKFYQFSIDETILLQRYMQQTIGDEEYRREFFIFLMEQISSSVPIVSEAIIESLIKSMESISVPIPYEIWRDNCLLSIIDYLRKALVEPSKLFLGTDSKEELDASCLIEKPNFVSVELNKRNYLNKTVTDLSRFSFEENFFAYLYKLTLGPTNENFENFIVSSSIVFCNNRIQKKPLGTFIEDMLKAKVPGCQTTRLSLNLPNYLINVEMAFLSPENFTWSDRLYKVFPNMLSDWRLTEGQFENEFYTFEYFDQMECKKGQVVFHEPPDPTSDFDLCIRFIEPRTSKFPYAAAKIFRKSLCQMEKRVNEIKSVVTDISRVCCRCTSARRLCSNCRKVADYCEEIKRLRNYVNSILRNGDVTFAIDGSNDVLHVKNLVTTLKSDLLNWRTKIEETKDSFDTSFNPNGANVFFLVDDCNGKYHFENINEEEGVKKVILILPL